jgi:hypothetical protein
MPRRDSEILLPDKGRIHLYDMAGVGINPEGVNAERNVYCYDKDGNQRWVIHRGKPIEGKWSTYIGIEQIPDGSIQVHASDGCVYTLDVETGAVTFLEWEK